MMARPVVWPVSITLGSTHCCLVGPSSRAPAFHIFVFQLFFFLGKRFKKKSLDLSAPQISTSLHHPPLWRISVFNVFFHLQKSYLHSQDVRLATDFSAFSSFLFRRITFFKHSYYTDWQILCPTKSISEKKQFLFLRR